MDKLIGTCLGVLVGAGAIFIAVHLIEAVWTALIVILGIGAFVVVAIVALRTRRNGW